MANPRLMLGVMDEEMKRPILWIVGCAVLTALGFLMGIAFERSNTPSIVDRTVQAIGARNQLFESFGYAASSKHRLEELSEISSMEDLNLLKKKISRQGACHASVVRVEIEETKKKGLFDREAMDELIAQASKLEEELGGCP